MTDNASPSPEVDASTIIYTETDEAPMLATYSFLPVISAYASTAGVDVQTRDISLAGRVIAQFPDRMTDEQRIDDELAKLGELAKTPAANIVKLPNISASLPQLKRCIAELQEAGYDLPDYPEEPSTEEEREIQAKFDVAKGSAVNPVLREGNSDRRAPESVKGYAQKNPHRMGDWSSDSKTDVATMEADDFAHTEQSHVSETEGSVRIELHPASGDVQVLKEVDVEAGEVVDAGVMRAAALDDFLKKAIEEAKSRDVLFSLHLKATMMKVSDPIIFGHAVRAFFPDLFSEHGDALRQMGYSANHGLATLHKELDAQQPSDKDAIEKAIEDGKEAGPRLSMVDDSKGITNLHVPSDVIIDASMPAMIRNGGQLWGPDGETDDTLAVIPESSYASLYQVVIDDCRENGQYDPATMGSVPNVGLMAKKAEEYGSHDKTFEISEPGSVKVIGTDGTTVILEHHVEPGDIWRMCQTKDEPIRDWVKLAVSRAKATGDPAIFWLDSNRAHDAQLIAKVEEYLSEHDTDGLDITIDDYVGATKTSVARIREGKNTISVTGNVLRDYLTDLFPILELGTSAKMLSVVPLMRGGGLFETGAGGSAPKHVQQLVEENHLRWDSLGEFLALSESFGHLAEKTDNERARILGETLDRATGTFLENDRSPSRKVGEIDNRGSHFYLALYWARELADQTEDSELAEAFREVADTLGEQEETITSELLEVQGSSVDIGGYFRPDPEKLKKVMRPSATFNEALEDLESRST